MPDDIMWDNTTRLCITSQQNSLTQVQCYGLGWSSPFFVCRSSICLQLEFNFKLIYPFYSIASGDICSGSKFHIHAENPL